MIDVERFLDKLLAKGVRFVVGNSDRGPYANFVGSFDMTDEEGRIADRYKLEIGRILWKRRGGK
jgi:hypothetical protein